MKNLLKNPNSIASIQNIDQKDLKEILNALKVANSNEHDIMFTKFASTLEKILKSLKDVLTTPAQREVVEALDIYQNQPQSNPLQWNWDTYFRFLSYRGLEESEGFKAMFPTNSDPLYVYNQYIAIAHANL